MRARRRSCRGLDGGGGLTVSQNAWIETRGAGAMYLSPQARLRRFQARCFAVAPIIATSLIAPFTSQDRCRRALALAPFRADGALGR
jgi:hypothetical protein